MLMKLVIDANVVTAYFKESVLGVDGQLTQKTPPVFDRLNGTDQVFLDASGHIKHEWREPVEKEWFDAWYPELLINGAAFEIPIGTHHQLRSKLERKCGFPRSKDFWYVKTAKSVANTFSEAFLITEDIDLHEPSKKSSRGSHRIEILLSRRGQIVRLLRDEGIHVHCVATYLDNLRD